jgi:phosphohistidine phosphatase
MKVLYLLRHAKSSWDAPSIPDHDRPLNDRGRRAAAVMGDQINTRGIRPEVVLCSTARRAVETLEAFSDMFAESADVHIERELYLAGVGELTDRVNELSQHVGSVMLIGHNPGMHDFAATLAGRGDQLDGLRSKFPTGALAVLEFDQEGWDLKPGTGNLREFLLPRALE